MLFSLFLPSNVSICRGLTLTNIAACDTHHRGVTLWVLVSGLCPSVWLEMGTSEKWSDTERERHDNHYHDSVWVWDDMKIKAVVCLPWLLSTMFCGCNEDTQIVQIPITLWPARPLGCGQPIFTKFMWLSEAQWGFMIKVSQSNRHSVTPQASSSWQDTQLTPDGQMSISLSKNISIS